MVEASLDEVFQLAADVVAVETVSSGEDVSAVWLVVETSVLPTWLVDVAMAVE